MSQVYKNLGSSDTVSSTTNLHEQIPITGSLLAPVNNAAVYDGTFPSESNVKYLPNHDHIDLYDYPFASSSANFLFSMSAGAAADLNLISREELHTISDVTKKNNIYRQYAQQYKGYDTNQNVIDFDVSGSLTPAATFLENDGGEKFGNLVFLNFSRVIMKDEIKKGSFQITIGTGSFDNPFNAGPGGTPGEDATHTFSDAYVNANDLSTYKTNSPMGDYAFLVGGTSTTAPTDKFSRTGLIFYQAGLVALALTGDTFGEELTSGSISSTTATPANNAETPEQAAVSGSVENICNGVRKHIQNIQFNNTTELNSTIYFCRANNNEFNYSSNPSFTSASQIVVKNNPRDPSITYATSVGLYSADNQLLAVGKLSEPLKKTSDTEFVLRVRIDY